LVTFDGLVAQTITAIDTAEFANITINKTDSLVLASPTRSNQRVITFTAGHVSSSSTAPLVFSNNATEASTSDASYVDGPTMKIGDDAFIFPVGDAGNYQPISIGAPTATGHSFTAQYFMDDPRTNWDETSLGGSLHHVSTEEYWILDRTNGTSDVAVTLSWDANSGGVNDLDSMVVARWNGSQWTDGGNGGTTGNAAAGTVTSSGSITSFSPFTLGSLTDIWATNPLPVELLSFNVKCEEFENVIEWKVYSEQNIDWYRLERISESSREIVIDERALGTRANGRTYTARDGDFEDDALFYVLSEVSRDGIIKVISKSEIDCGIEKLQDLSFVPNPFVGAIRLESTLLSADRFPVVVEVIDVQGALLKSTTLNNMTESIDLMPLPSGIYFLRSTDKFGKTQFDRMVKTKP
jgi:hypothetical protein